ncbi:LrgB family protein [Ottowia thiooxydans]|uniref:LrgB family protein n=1 Tax=Ottowia thiooxydans TaxID=219182 RepID=UPI00040E7BAB|nr:LrgB family protein [Ottowia thiooxydans]
MIDALASPSGAAMVLAATLLTLVAYGLALWAYQRSGWELLLPILTGTTLVVVTLLAMDIPYRVYREGTALLSWLAGPATVALALPLYAQRARLRGIWWPVVGAVLAGSATAVISAIGIAWLLGANWELMMSLAPKSATMPVAMPLAQSVGGVASMSAVAVALTGIAAAVFSTRLFSLLRVKSDTVRGLALGAAAHAIGTARAVQLSETAVAFAALAMGLTALITSILVPLIVRLL